MMGPDTLEACRGWRNILRISCASSWFFFTRLYREARSRKHKTLRSLASSYCIQTRCYTVNPLQTRHYIRIRKYFSLFRYTFTTTKIISSKTAHLFLALNFRTLTHYWNTPIELGYVRHVTARTIFVRHRSGVGTRHAFTENNRADDVTSPPCFYFMEMAEEGEEMIKMISTGPAQLSFHKIKSKKHFYNSYLSLATRYTTYLFVTGTENTGFCTSGKESPCSVRKGNSFDSWATVNRTEGNP